MVHIIRITHVRTQKCEQITGTASMYSILLMCAHHMQIKSALQKKIVYIIITIEVDSSARQYKSPMTNKTSVSITVPVNAKQRPPATCNIFYFRFVRVADRRSRQCFTTILNVRRLCMVYFKPNPHKKQSCKVMYRTLYLLFCRDSGKLK